MRSPAKNALQPRIQGPGRRRHNAQQRSRRDHQILNGARASAKLLLADVLSEQPGDLVGDRVGLAAMYHRFRQDIEDQETEDIAGHEGYLTVGLFENNQPGELFITMAKEGSTIGGLMDSIGTLTSMALQYGVPLEALVRKFAHQRLRPQFMLSDQ